MNRQDIYEYLKKKGIQHKITEHEAVYNMEELSEINIPYPEAVAKNLFVRDDKKKNFYLIIVKGDKKVNLKEFRQKLNTRPLSFASEQDLLDIMDLRPGSVSPFGILNDSERTVSACVDQDFMGLPGIIGVHPNENTATVWLKTDDLIALLKEHGNTVSIVSI